MIPKNLKKFIDPDKEFPNIPVKLGSVLRTPRYGWVNWAVPEYLKPCLLELGDSAYEVEWKGGSKRQIEYVAETAKRAGLGDANQRLRERAGEFVCEAIRKKSKDGRVYYVEPGAGLSTLVVVDRLEEEGFDFDRLYMLLLEPSPERTDFLIKELKQRGLKEGEHFLAEAKRDYDVKECMDGREIDVVYYLATLHHHPAREPVLRVFANYMSKDGTIVIGDWFNSKWEHPRKVKQVLYKLPEWKTKEEDIRKFDGMFCKNSRPLKRESESLQRANEMIDRFWINWAGVRKEAILKGEFDERDEIYMLEASTPVERLEKEMERAGFRVYHKESLEKDSELLSVVIGKLL